MSAAESINQRDERWSRTPPCDIHAWGEVERGARRCERCGALQVMDLSSTYETLTKQRDDLLAALERIEHALVVGSDKHLDGALHIAREAIAKARGEASV